MTFTDCGQPPAGTNTDPVVTSTTTFQNTFTYTCLIGYTTGDNTETVCVEDGMWSENAPVCIEIGIKLSANF